MPLIKLSQLLYNLYDTPIYSDVEITGLALDSRQVQPGDLFFACIGKKQDGRKFIEAAIDKGAHAVLAEVDTKSVAFHKQNNVPIFPVHKLDHRVGEIASQFYGYPTKKIKVVGVTGTNGKTSCSHFIAQALTILDKTCGVIGTLGNGIYGNLKATSLTTPDPVTLQLIFAQFLKQHIKYAAMEVSSHSLDQGRANGTEFEIGIFTNLTRDHLDYHENMEAYGNAKKKLFLEEVAKQVIINADDEFGQTLLTSLPRKNIYAYSISSQLSSSISPTSNHTSTKSNKSIRVKAQSENKSGAAYPTIPIIYADQVKFTLKGIEAIVYTPWGEGKLSVPLLGPFNLSNVLAALTALCLLKIPLSSVLDALSQLTPVPGRMQTMGGGKKPLVIVDYAHTPDALEKVLKALKAHTQGKLYCLFGCGGDRDRGKRPLMAKIAEELADQVMLTDDNPRTEASKQIMDDILQGFGHPKKIIIEPDRAKAIQAIIQCAQVGDCVLIAGKGAETSQLIGDQKIPFSDVDEVNKGLGE